MKVFITLAVAVLAATPAVAQLAPPNEAGVTVGHMHLAVKDVDVQKKFFTEALGGVEVKNGPLSLIQFPGIYVLLRQAEPTGPPAGSIVNHFGFVVKDLPAMMAKWKTMGLKYDQGDVNPNQGYINAPADGIRIELFGDPTIPTPVRMDHVHVYPMDPPAMQAWYAMTFGGVVGRRAVVARLGWIDTNEFPGVINFSFSPGPSPPAPTKGQSLDHIGFDVKNLDAFVKKLDAQGIKIDAPVRQVPNTNTRIAFLTNPWGTYIELTENLSPTSAGSK